MKATHETFIYNTQYIDPNDRLYTLNLREEAIVDEIAYAERFNYTEKAKSLKDELAETRHEIHEWTKRQREQEITWAYDHFRHSGRTKLQTGQYELTLSVDYPDFDEIKVRINGTLVATEPKHNYQLIIFHWLNMTEETLTHTLYAAQ